MAKLTKTKVEGAKPPKRKEGESDTAYRKRWRWIGDGGVGGFGVKVYGSGRRVYALRYRTESGRTRMLTLGPHGELTPQEARDRARLAKVDVRDGTDPQAERAKRAAELGTVKELMSRWLKDYAKAHRKRWEDDEYRIEARILPGLGRLALEDVTVEAVGQWHRKAGKEAPVEANRALETVRAAWRWAEGEELLPEGAPDSKLFRGGRRAKIKRFPEKSRDRWLRKQEVARLMEATNAHEDPYVRAAIPLYLLTGLRKRELLNARWEHLDMERQEIRLPDTKSGTAQVRLLPDAAVEIIRDLPRMKGSPFVFPSPADPSKPRGDMKKPWDRIRQEADLEDVTLHDLRRTAGSYMAQAGIPLQVIQEVLGQSHPGVTKVYARLASENEREALDTLAEALGPALGLAARKPEALPDRLRALLEAAENDPDALAEGLRGLVDWTKAAEA
ncbi:MAG: tyrosine-type recombinase/integrase [Gemmatimonadota bacterium]